MRHLLIILGFIVGGIVFTSHLNRGLTDAPANAVWPTYRRVDWWILSARCTQVRGVLLAACGPDNKLYPIEDVSPTDDRGHGLAANLVALFQKRPFDKVDMVRINVWINAVGVALLSLELFLCGMPWASFLCLISGAVYGIPGPMASADAQATFFGEYCLILTSVPWIVQFNCPIVSRWRLVIAGLISGLALIVAILLREANGLVGIVCAFFFLSLAIWESRPISLKKASSFVAIAAFLLVALASNSLMLSLRNHWLGLPPAHLISSHGIAHAFHQGLGTEENPWGIRYDDRNGAETVSKVNPQLMYGTPAYYAEMQRLYLDIVLHHPLQVSWIYLKKLKKTIALPLQFGGFSIFWYVLAVTLALPFLRKTYANPSIPLRATAGMELILAVFLLQGVFIRPVPWFLYPAKFGVLMLLIGLFEAAVSWLPGGLSHPGRS